MKLICGNRGKGKTSYILNQCRVLPGTKLILTHSAQAAARLRGDILSDKELRDCTITVQTVWYAAQEKTRGDQYSYIFIDDLDMVVEYIIRDYLHIDPRREVTAMVDSDAVKMMVTSMTKLEDA